MPRGGGGDDRILPRLTTIPSGRYSKFMAERGSISTRDGILLAADRVVVEGGVSGLTLEAVAREAGISKGGLLYHFPSKEALISGMVGRLVDGFTEALGRELAREKGSASGRWLRAYARASFADDRWHLEVSGEIGRAHV